MQNKDWPNLARLVTDQAADIALLGAPMTKGCVTPSDYHKAPAAFRKALSRISTYDVEIGTELGACRIHDFGNVECATLSPADAYAPIVKELRPLTKDHELSLLIGGHNGITRPGVYALDPSLQSVGLLTLDAHFDLRPTDQGPMNGNPVRCLLEDGLPGEHIVQIGIAPFANTADMHRTAIKSGISIYTREDCHKHGVPACVAQGLKYLSERCDVIYVDFDIDVIERGLSPGAPGGRPGGWTPTEFFEATRLIGSHPKVKVVDLCEFDPGLDLNQTTALIAGRWLGELLAGYQQRP